MSIMAGSEQVTRNARDLLSVEAFEFVSWTVQDNNSATGMDTETAERITEEALKFLAACAVTPGPLRPSRIVDEGWHALILHTKIYRKLCLSLGVGQFIDHVPERPDPKRQKAEWLDRTQQAIRAAGYVPDMTLWLSPADGSIPVAAGCGHDQCNKNCQGGCAAPCSPSPN